MTDDLLRRLAAEPQRKPNFVIRGLEGLAVEVGR